jgi:hypothetical protein
VPATKTRVSDLQLAESKHQYTDPRTGQRVVSVTSIVGAFDSGDKLGAGAGAAVKLTKEGYDYRQVWREKAETGSRVHNYAQLWVEGRQADVPDEEGAYMDAFAGFCNDYHPQWIEVERAVVHSMGYGGRFDMIGEIESWTSPSSSESALIDIKTGKTYADQLTLQLAGYRFADGMIEYDTEGMAVGLEPMPHIDVCAGLYLHNDGTYDLKYVQADDEAFACFASLLRIKGWAKKQ